MTGEAAASEKYEHLMADRELLTSLMEAAAKGDTEELRAVTRKIESRYEGQCKDLGNAARAELLLGFKDATGRSVAHFAALGGSIETLAEVLELCPGAGNVGDKSGKTPLFVAASLGNLAAVELLIDKGALVNAEAEGGGTPLHEAVYAGKTDAVKLLLAHGATVNKVSSLGTPVQIAAVTLQLEILKLLLEAGADPNMLAQQALSAASPFPPALILAASKGATDAVKLLLENGADPDCTDSEGFTPLHCTAEANSLACSKLLLDHGADWGAVARDGTTPLDLARRHNSTVVAKHLEALGINPKPKRPVLFPPIAGSEQSACPAASASEARSSRAPIVIELDANLECPKEVMVKVERLKDEGNAAFRQNKFSLAKEKYSQAISACPRAEDAKELLAVLFSNRSFANENLKDAEGALQDAQVVLAETAS
ncbi:hypothetical protein Emag_002982 [Eimeria magna]